MNFAGISLSEYKMLPKTKTVSRKTEQVSYELPPRHKTFEQLYNCMK